MFCSVWSCPVALSGGPNKVPFVVRDARFQHDAVATTDDGKPERLLLHVVKGHEGKSIEAMAKAHLASTAHIVSNGLGCFRAVTKAGCTHTPVNVTKAENHGEKLACFRWVNTVLGNLKSAIVGTLRSVRRHYAFRYLAEFQYRFNRRFDLAGLLEHLARTAVRAAPRPYTVIKVAYGDG